MGLFGGVGEDSADIGGEDCLNLNSVPHSSLQHVHHLEDEIVEGDDFRIAWLAAAE